jgi:isopenicillin-N epimerase
MDLRPLFLLDPRIVFLNHGSFGACPAEVLAEQHRWQRELERNPVELLGRRSAALLASARAALAAYVGARGEDLIFVPNATYAVNAIARSLPLADGDEILTTDHEYGACEATWGFACKRGGARVVRVEIPLPLDAGSFAERVLSAIGPRTRVLFLSHVTSTTALIFPLAEVVRGARERGVLVVVDGAHSPGQLPLDLDALGADFYTGNCHKWLCAPKGAAFLHARPERQAMLDAPVVSWGYCAEVEGHAGFDAYTGATTLERRLQWQGTRDLSAFLTVPAAIEFQRRHRWDEVRARCHASALDVMHRWCARVGEAPVARDDDFAQMSLLPVPACSPEALKDWLFDQKRIEIPVTTHRGRVFVRVSVQGYNDATDLDALLAALGERFGV